MNPIEIVGGGLAGLALGGALARRGVSVTIFEAQVYPRHKVCGEFICGLRPEVATGLELDPVLRDAREHRRMRWHWHEQAVREDVLPVTARGISRHTLDQRLADAFVRAGGTLVVRTRVRPEDCRPGRVWAHGRRAAATSEWLGLKVHCRNFRPAADLEFHLAPGAYVGAAEVEAGAVNVCGLFRRRRDVHAKPAEILPAYLRASGLGGLAERVNATMDPATTAAVAALSFDRALPVDRVALGDALAMIPPFTGDGMAMAFESAWLAVHPLCEYATGRRSWEETARGLQRSLRRRFHRRLLLAGVAQRIIAHHRGQAGFALLARRGLLPFRVLFRWLH